MNSLNVGIIGCGNISGIYLQNIPAYRGLTLRACADMRPEVAQAQASRHGIEAMSVDQLLARDDIDLVVNLTIPAAHFGVSLAALSAGKHVLCEKPLALDAPEVDAMAAAAQETGRRVVEASWYRWHPRVRLAQQRLPEISLATVYNTLNELVALGEVLEVTAGEGPKRYDPKVGERHQHLVCVRCNELLDVRPDGEKRLGLSPAELRGYRLLDVELVFRGICPSCQQAG